MNAKMDICGISHEPLSSTGTKQKTVKLGCVGANTINNAASDRKVSIKLAEGDTVHVQCRAKFTNMKYIQIFLRKKQNKETLMKSLKSPAGCTRGRGVDEIQTAV